MDRLKAHAASRGTDGRGLSRVDEALKADLEEALKADLEALLAIKAPVAMVDPVTMDILLAEARLYGVSV